MYGAIRGLGNNYKGIDVRWVESSDSEMRQLNINSFPTLMYRDVNANQILYEGERHLHAIQKWLDSK